MKRNIILITIALLILSPLVVKANEQEVNPTFSLYVLAYDSQVRCPGYSLYIYPQLEYLGIDILEYDSAEYSEIAFRTWNYPYIDYDYIPTYEQGGFDICILQSQWNLDWSPLGRFSSCSCPLTRRNFCQFCNVTFDLIESQYLNVRNYTDFDYFLSKMQNILYEELPAISIYYLSDIFLLSKNISSFDTFLFSQNEFNPETWEDSYDDELIYIHPYNETGIGQYLGIPNNFIFPLPYIDGKWIKSVYGSLFRRDPISHEYIPYLAQDFTISSSGYNITINLRSDIKFSNGDNVTAEDVKYTYDLLKTPALKLTVYSNPYSSMIDNVTVVDSNTLIFNLNQPFTNLIEAHTSPIVNTSFELLNFGIIKKSLVEPLVSTYGFDIFKQQPFSTNISDELLISCGPYRISEFNLENLTYELVPNEYWFGDEPKINRIQIKHVAGKDGGYIAVQNGFADVADKNYFFHPLDVGGQAKTSIVSGLKTEDW
ncbi:MAG: hypothetical protein KAU62_03950, partial [Candidatus Heimdallarchaeota archaeon]|nr:hypothetical protein [Candidatus Heimdallarchaeota archaeon]MCK4610290.1 hypothetical protein [Candidatus Heimdallarchaeota archaeon]